MGYGHANCQKCGRPTFVYPEVGEDESWVICDRCIEDGVAVDWPGYAGRLEAELAVLKADVWGPDVRRCDTCANGEDIGGVLEVTLCRAAERFSNTNTLVVPHEHCCKWWVAREEGS
jgi:hypothetical protein